MYAVIATGGKQYRVTKDGLLSVEKLYAEPEATVEIGEVLRFSGLARRVWREHDAILAAMARGDADDAARLIHDHVVRAYQDVKSAVPGPHAARGVSAA